MRVKSNVYTHGFGGRAKGSTDSRGFRRLEAELELESEGPKMSSSMRSFMTDENGLGPVVVVVVGDPAGRAANGSPLENEAL